MLYTSKIPFCSNLCLNYFPESESPSTNKANFAVSVQKFELVLVRLVHYRILNDGECFPINSETFDLLGHCSMIE